MVTWLDWYVWQLIEGRLAEDGLRLPSSSKDRHPADYAEALGYGMLDYIIRLGHMTDDEHISSTCSFFSSLLPFLLPHEEKARCKQGFLKVNPDCSSQWMDGRAVRVSKELGRCFVGADLGEQVRRAAEQSIKYKNTWYIDIPDRLLVLDDHHQVRAVFAQPVEMTKAIVVTCIITQPGSNYPIIRPVWTYGDTGHSRPLDEDSDLLWRDVVKSIENFFLLSVAYCAEASNVDVSAVPRLSRDESRKPGGKKRKKWRAAAKKASLFSISDLRAPPGRFGKQRSDDADTGWKLGHRVRVRGHFRWQPHGPRQSLRKLIWIREHERGPADAPLKKRLEVV